MQIAGFEKRVGGWLIDKALSWLLLAGLIVAFRLTFPPDFSIFLEIVLALFLTYLAYAFFNGTLLYLTKGYTIGTALFRIKTSSPSRRLGYAKCLLKSLLTGVSAVCLVNAIYMLSTHTERSAFDRLTSTLMIDVKASD